jgi:hypothetical protein
MMILFNYFLPLAFFSFGDSTVTKLCNTNTTISTNNNIVISSMPEYKHGGELAYAVPLCRKEIYYKTDTSKRICLEEYLESAERVRYGSKIHSFDTLLGSNAVTVFKLKGKHHGAFYAVITPSNSKAKWTVTFKKRDLKLVEKILGDISFLDQ